MRRTILVSIALAFLAGTLAIAQQMPGPPKVLEIIREEVKTGKGPAHEKHEVAWLHAMLANKYTSHNLAISSVTGRGEMWFLIGFDSFASWEKEGQMMEKNPALSSIMETYGEKDAEYISDSRTILARYRPELSYKAGVNIGEYRYFAIGVLRVKMGEDVGELYKVVNGAREKVDLDTHAAVYQVTSGMPAGTYITFTPLKNVSAWDMQNEAYEAALKEANFSGAVAKTVMSFESRLFAFDPATSNVGEETAAADPDYWHPKASMAKPKSAGGAAKPEPKK